MDATTARHFLSDPLGTTVALADGSGAVQTEYTYGAFGTTTTTGSSTTNRSGFTGRDDDGTGLHHYRTRYYDSLTQRFISEDPIGFNGGLNVFSYVSNKPTSFTDPLGLKPGDGFGANARQGASGGSGQGRGGRGGPGGRGGGGGGGGNGNGNGRDQNDDSESDCVQNCMRAENARNYKDYTRNAKITAVAAPILGVGACALLVACDPYLAPSFAACASARTASTLVIGEILAAEKYGIQTMASYAGCILGCKGF